MDMRSTRVPNTGKIICVLVMVTIYGCTCTTAAQSNEVTVGCPTACSCVSDGQPDSGVVVNCSNVGFASVPVNIPRDTVELDISSNPGITELTVDTVEPSSLRNLRRLTARSCQLTLVNVDVFNRELLPRLDTLDLSHNDIEKMSISSDDAYVQTSLSQLILSRNKIRYVTDVQLKFYPDLRHLDLDDNLIATVSNRSFCQTTNSCNISTGQALMLLETLSMRGNRITHIDSGVFKNMSSLKRLDLSKNRLSNIDADMFSGLVNLQQLELSTNQLILIGDDAFRSLASLHRLDLSRNKLPRIPRGLPMLDWLDMSHNAVCNVSEDQQADLYPVEVVNLAGNPLHCDCRMLWLKELFDSREYLLRLKVVDADPADFVPVCATPPALTSRSWDLLSDDLFVCSDGDEDSTTSGGTATTTTELLQVRLGAVTDQTVDISWSIESPVKTVVIQHYVFGLRTATVKHVQVGATLRQYTLRRLRPGTSYMVCVVPILGDVGFDGSNVTPLSFDHCVEVATKDAVVPLELPSQSSMFGCYVCGMMVTVACVLGCIGIAAMLFGVVFTGDTVESKQHTE